MVDTAGDRWASGERLPGHYDDLLGLKPPKLDQKVVERLSDEQIRAMVKACSGTDFRDRRDEAIVRFTRATAAERAAEESRRLNLGDL